MKAEDKNKFYRNKVKSYKLGHAQLAAGCKPCNNPSCLNVQDSAPTKVMLTYQKIPVHGLTQTERQSGA